MSIEACPTPREDCPWYDRQTPKTLRGQQEHGCYSDIDHITPQRFRTMGFLVRYYIHTPENKQQICRWEHDNKPLESIDDIPDEQYMVEAILRAMHDGTIRLGLRDRERLTQIRQELGDIYE